MKEENIEKYIQEKKDLYSKMGFYQKPVFYKMKRPHYYGRFPISSVYSLQVEFGGNNVEDVLYLYYIPLLEDENVRVDIINSKNKRWVDIDKIVESLIYAINKETSTDVIAKNELDKIGFTTVKFENNKYFGICEVNNYNAILVRIDYSSKKQQIYLVENILQNIDFRDFQFMNLQPKGNISKEVLNTWIEAFK